MEVRLATSKDVNDLIDLVREAHAEEPAVPLSFDDNGVFNVILRAMSGDAVIGVIDGPGEIQSSCYLSICTPWYSTIPIIESLWFFTRPDYRRSANSKYLLTWARKQAERLGCPMQLEISTNESAKPKLSLCERVLGAPTGRIFVYLPNPESPTDISDIEVFPAEPGDEPQVFNTIRQLSIEDGAYPPSEEMAIPFIRSALSGDGIIGIIRPQNEIEALVFLKIARPWYSKDVYLDEYLLYCKPQFRKSKDARSLVQFAKRQSDRLDIPLRIGITSKIETERKLQLYQRMLGDPTNAHFLYRPDTI